MKAMVLLKKDIRTVLRNRRELFWMILLPIILLAVNFYIQGRALQVEVGVVGEGPTRALLQQRAADMAGQLDLRLLRLAEEEAISKLAAGSISGYLLLTEEGARLYANQSDAGGAVAAAFMTQVIQDHNRQLAAERLVEMVDDPTSILESVSWEVIAVGDETLPESRLLFSTLFVIMGIMTALSLGQQSVSMEKDRNTLISLRKSPLTDKGIVWAKLGAGLFSSLLPLVAITALVWAFMPDEFLYQPFFYVILLFMCFNSVALGVLVGTYVRGANEANSLRFVLTLPAMFLASLPISMPQWLDRLASAVPTLVSAQLIRRFLISGTRPDVLSLSYLFLSALLAMHLAANFLGREE